MLFDGEERFAGRAIEEKQVALLRGLGDGVYLLAVGANRDQRGWRREVAVPDIVMDALEVPDSLAGVRVERQQSVGVEIVADAVCTVEVVDGGARGDVDDAALFIERHAGPVVGGAGDLPCVLRPRLVARFSRTGDGVKDPAEFAGMHVVGANVTAERGLRLRRAKADDDHVFVDQAGRGESGEGLCDIAFGEIFAQVDLAAFTEAGDQFAVCRVERVEIAQTGQRRGCFAFHRSSS